MSLLQLRGLGVVTPRPLFKNLDLTIHPGDRIGLIAGNGAGKSTLLRCLTGQAEPSTGEIIRRRGLHIGFVPQDTPNSLLELSLYDSVRRALPPPDRVAESWKVDLILDMLDAPEAMRERPVSALSGGWQRLALIARAWITEPELLLLDEPTNHLDLQRLAVLEDFLRQARDDVAIIVASHDRQFLDNSTNRTLFLRPDLCRSYGHPFSRARALLADDEAAQQAQFTKDAKEADRLRRNAGQLRNVGVNSGSDLLLKKSKQLRERAEAIERTLRPERRTRDGDIHLANRGTHAKVLLSIDEASVATPDGRFLFRTGKLKILQGDRIVVLGENGVGKSQLVRLLRRTVLDGEAISGLTVSATVSAFYLDQHMSQLPDAESLFHYIASFGVGDQRNLSLLAGAGFDVTTQRRPIALLSPGQKARLALLGLRLAEPNFYLMDEPSNHIDIAGQERLEAEILSQAATCVLVSHDRYFMRAIGTRFWLISAGRLQEVEPPP